MSAPRTDPRTHASLSVTVRAWLMLRLHLYAARHEPLRYMTALWWRVCGKRLRARAQMAPLLAVSPHAYRVWLLGELAAETSGAVGPKIVALVNAQDPVTGSSALDETLRSIEREGIAAIVVGSQTVPTLVDAARRIAWNEAPWLMPLAPGDVVAPGAADAYRSAVAQSQARLVYADDDLLDTHGERSAPHFKPAWNAELFRHFDYLTGACIVQVGAQDLLGMSGPEWPARLVAAVAGSAAGEVDPLRVPRILHHRRVRPNPRVPARLALADDLPSVTVIVPTRNRVELLRTCLDGLARTDYPECEVIVVDNDSDESETLAYLAGLDTVRHRVLRHPGPFNFSALNNRAAEQAKGRLLCMLNNDIEVIEPGWLKTMAMQALRPDTGAVGARLLYPDGRIQHAGVVLGVGGGAAHAHRLLKPNEEGYFRRHALPQFASAVTAACLVIQCERFKAVGGFDEAKFAVAFNDVDLCMRLNRRGWQSFYEPRATLIHHESVSRGLDRDPVGARRFAGELAALKTTWGTDKDVDPFHHPALSPFSEQFVVRL